MIPKLDCHTGMLVKLIDRHCGDLVLLEPDGDTHALPVRFIPDVPNTVNYFVPGEFGDLFDQLGFIDLVGKFADNEGFLLGALIFLDQYSGPDANAAPAGLISIPYALTAVYNAARRKIRTRYKFAKLIDGNIGIVDERCSRPR